MGGYKRNRKRLDTFPLGLVFDALAQQGIRIPLPLKSRSKVMLNGIQVKAKRASIFAWMGIKCCHCGREGTYFALERDYSRVPPSLHFDLYTADGMMMTFDHIIPRSEGGPNTVANLQTLCESCNYKKGTLPDPLISQGSNLISKLQSLCDPKDISKQRHLEMRIVSAKAHFRKVAGYDPPTSCRKLKKRIKHLEKDFVNIRFLAQVSPEEITKRKQIHPILRELFEAKKALRLTLSRS